MELGGVLNRSGDPDVPRRIRAVIEDLDATIRDIRTTIILGT